MQDFLQMNILIMVKEINEIIIVKYLVWIDWLDGMVIIKTPSILPLKI